MARSFQFQQKTQPAAAGNELVPTVSSWLGWWTEPPKPKIAKGLTIALMASGLFAPPVAPSLDPGLRFNQLVPNVVGLQFTKTVIYQINTEPVFLPETIATKWFEPLSEPKRTRALNVSSQQSLTAPVTIVVPEVITEDKWHQAWSTPVRLRTLSSAQQRSFFAPETVIVSGNAVGPAAFSSDVVFPKSIIYQSVAWNPLTPTTEIITEDKWHQAWSQPFLKKTLQAAQQPALSWSGVTPQSETITEDKWHYPWSEPVRVKRLLTAEQKAFFAPEATIPTTTAIEPTTIAEQVVFPRSIIYQAHTEPQLPQPSTFTYQKLSSGVGPIFQKTIIYQESVDITNPGTDKFWFEPFSDPVRKQPGLAAHEQQFIALNPSTPVSETITEDKWHQSWSLPVRKRILSVSQQRAFFAPEATIPTPAAVVPETISAEVIFPRSIIYQAHTEPQSTPAAEVITEDKWHQGWSLPVRTRNLPVSEQRSYFAPEATIPRVAAVEPTTLLSEVVFPRSIIYQSLSWNPFTSAEIVTLDKWYQAWSLPVRTRYLSVSEQRAYFAPEATISTPTVVAPTTISAEVVFPRSIIYQAYSSGYLPAPSAFIEGWYAPFRDPVRPKRGLGAWEQRDLFWSNPSFTGTQIGPTTITSGITFPRSVIYQAYASPVFTPPLTIAITLSATEINRDRAIFGIVVYGKAAKANVSIKEIPNGDSANASIEET